MDNLHRAYLSLGSNIEAEVNLRKAIQLLGEYGKVDAISSIWETKSVGFDGPNFLNACVLFLTQTELDQLKEKVIRPIEAKLGRVRCEEKNAPRTIDIDILLFDEKPVNVQFWEYAFVIVPLAELLPDFIHPAKGEKLSQVAEPEKGRTWIVKRSDLAF